MKNHIVVTIIVALVVGAGAFYGGMKYAQGATIQTNVPGGSAGSQQGGRRFGGTGGAAGRGNLINGTVIAKDDKSITIQLRSGGSQFIFFSPSTQILKSTNGTSVDLTNGTNVVATGTTNSDGSVSAQMIQIRPAGEMFGGPGAGSTQQTQQPGTQNS